MAYTEPNRPITAILADVLNQVARLARAEGQLVRAEMAEKAGEVGLGLGLVIAGSVLSIPALVILFQGLVAVLISAGLLERNAYFAVGGAALAIGLVLGAVGASRLKVRHLTPQRTIRQLQRDVAQAKETMRRDDGIPERAA